MTTPYNQAMDDWLDTDLLELARLYLQNEDLFVARRCVQRFKAGRSLRRTRCSAFADARR